jgi:hypothetical protein
MAGLWAAAQSGDVIAWKRFHNFLVRLSSVFDDVAVQVCVWMGDASIASDAPLRALAIGERGASSAVWDGDLKQLGHVDSAIWALAQGVSLEQRIAQLRDRSPEQLFQSALAHCRENSAGAPDYVVAHDEVDIAIYYVRALARSRRPNDASKLLRDATKRLHEEPNGSRYLALKLKEAQLQVFRTEWELTRRPDALIACVRQMDDAIACAKQLNLPQWVQRLNEIPLA